jgi:hypothetical protein
VTRVSAHADVPKTNAAAVIAPKVFVSVMFNLPVVCQDNCLLKDAGQGWL